MPSGKVHTIIGVGATAVAGYALCKGNFIDVNSIKDAGTAFTGTAKFMVPAITGSVLGSLIVDIDSKKSKGSQMFNKTLMSVILLTVGVKLLTRYGIDAKGLTGHASTWLNFIMSMFTNSLGMMLFAGVTILGKLSPHRGFTHKWLGTVCFILTAAMGLNKEMFFGFAIGYVAHLVADEVLSHERIKWYEFRLPMMNSKNKFKPVF